MLSAFTLMKNKIICVLNLFESVMPQQNFYRRLCQNFHSYLISSSDGVLIAVGILFLFAGLKELSLAQESEVLLRSYSEASFDDGLIRASVGNLFCLIEGAFGALLMVVAGLGAIIAAAMGAYRAALGMLVVAVGAFILRSLVSLFFGTGFDAYASSSAPGCE